MTGYSYSTGSASFFRSIWSSTRRTLPTFPPARFFACLPSPSPPRVTPSLAHSSLSHSSTDRLPDTHLAGAVPAKLEAGGQGQISCRRKKARWPEPKQVPAAPPPAQECAPCGFHSQQGREAHPGGGRGSGRHESGGASAPRFPCWKGKQEQRFLSASWI